MAEVNTLLMKIKDIKGTSNIDGYNDWIVLNHINTAFSARVDINDKGSVAVGGPQMEAIQFSKVKDGTDIKITMAMFGSTVYDKVEIVKIIDNNSTKIISEKIELLNFAFTFGNKCMSNSGEAVISYSGVCSGCTLEGNEVDAMGKVTKFGPVGYDFSKAKKM